MLRSALILPLESNVAEQHSSIDVDQGLYVIMIHSKLRVIGDESVRYQVDDPETFGIARCHWSTRYIDDHFGTSRPDGVDIVIEVHASNHQDAEDKALGAARQIIDFVGFYAGSNESSEILVKTAKLTNDGQLGTDRRARVDTRMVQLRLRPTPQMQIVSVSAADVT